MAAYTDQPSRPRRFLKVYLAFWATAAVGAFGYLSLLALQPSHTAPTRTQVAEPEPNQVMRTLINTAKDVSTIRRNLNDMQKDVADLKEAATERDAKDKGVAVRLSAVEERVAAFQTTVEANETTPQKGRAADRLHRKNAEPKVSGRQDLPAPAQTPPAPSFRADGPPVPLETGSIPKEEITFGEPVVTKSGPATFAVQLAAGPSLQGLRQSWGQLRERHGALGALEARVVAPKSDGGPYRLLAGPFATRAEADRVCTEMGVGRNGCYVTTYIGTPL